jgi:hypothetical protein
MIIQANTKCYPHKLLCLRLYGIATLVYAYNTHSIQVSLLSPARAREVLEFEADQYLTEVLGLLLEHSGITYRMLNGSGCVVTN